jgi:hypothetical protein
MLRSEFGKEFPDGSSLPIARFFKTLADPLVHVGLAANVEQVLVRLGILDDGRSLAFHRDYDRALAILELLHELTRAVSEFSE